MFLLPRSILILISKLKRFSKHSTFNFFVDWSMTDAKLFFEAPSQPSMMINNIVRLVCLYKLLMRELIS